MDKYRIRPGQKVKLSKIDPNDDGNFKGDKEVARAATEKLNRQLEEMQALLYAEHKHKVLIVLQAMDTAGKDGVIRVVFDGVNPQGVRVAAFKAPTGIELDHDFLWRVHQHAPAKGEMVIFNRSHYEDVLVVRVKGYAPQDVWEKHYRHITEFERLLADSDTLVLKFYLHIDKDEQKKRLNSRLKDKEKHWKFNIADLDDRKLWDKYMEAYEDAMEKTSSEHAPWYVIPANHKWYRDYVISRILVDSLKGLGMKYPPAAPGLNKVKVT